MLKIYYNTDTDAPIDGPKLNITISGTYCKAEVINEDGDQEGFDVVQAMQSYSSYLLVPKNGKVKVFRKMYPSGCKFFDLNRLGIENRLDFARLTELYTTGDIVQFDTGIVAGNTRDIVARVFTIHKDNIHIDADEDYEFLPFSSNALEFGDHPRFHLWDSYSVQINSKELQANRKGRPVNDGDFETPISCEPGKDYIDIAIQKYQGDFEGEVLTRDIDNEDVFIETSGGILNATRVKLDHGKAKVRLYPFGYAGEIKLKLGRRWYRCWNEYNLTIGNSEEA